MEDRISLCSQILLRYGRFQLKRSPASISQKIATFPNDDMCCYLPRSPSPASREAALLEFLLWLLWFCFSIFSFYYFLILFIYFFPPDIFLSPSVVCMSRLLRLWHDTSHSHQAGLSLVRSQNTGLSLVEADFREHRKHRRLLTTFYNNQRNRNILFTVNLVYIYEFYL